MFHFSRPTDTIAPPTVIVFVKSGRSNGVSHLPDIVESSIHWNHKFIFSIAITVVGYKWREMPGDLDGSLTGGATGGDDSCTGEFPSVEVSNFLRFFLRLVC